MRADLTMSEEMKLFFLWPKLRHDIWRRVRDQGPTTYADAIRIAQRIEMVSTSDHTSNLPMFQHPPKNTTEPSPVPMDIDIQNALTAWRQSLPEKDAQGHPKCFYCNNYGHIKKYFRKLKATQQVQNVQIVLANATSLAELPGN